MFANFSTFLKGNMFGLNVYTFAEPEVQRVPIRMTSRADMTVWSDI